MKKVVLGALASAGLVMAAIGVLAPEGDVFAQTPVPESRAGGGPQLIALPGPIDDGGQLFTVVDPQMRAIGVYRVETATGKIELKSVRRIHWDLQMMNLNTEKPLPQEIRSLLEQRLHR